MDKNRIVHDKKQILVHRTPRGILQSVHKAYGLMILGGGAGICAPPDSFLHCPERYFEHYSISHMLEGEGRLWLEDGREFDVEPGDAIVIVPGTVNRYGGINGKIYREDSLTFTGPVAGRLRRAGVIRDGVFHFGKTRRLLPIQNLQRDPAHSSQIKANIELQKLLVDLYLTSLEPVSGYPLFQQLLTDLKSDPARWWTVSEMAEACRLSDDQLRRIFLKYTGCRPKRYLERLKLRRAGEALISTDRPAAAIARDFGYRDPYHFSRRFKLVMGFSPQRFRENAASSRGGFPAGREPGSL